MATVRRAMLENGLRVIAVEMPQTSYVAVRLVVGAGSRDDPREKAGISHFVEHVIFRGTERHPHEAALRAHCASLGIRSNAFTSKETTSLDADVPRENIVGALQFLSEVLTTPTFNGLEIERRIVMEEMNNAYDERDGSLWPIALFADSKMWPYNGLGLPCIGEPRTVLDITLADVKDYLATHYRAGGMALAIAGGFELDAIWPDVRRYFGILPPGQPARVRKRPLPITGSMHWLDHAFSPRAAVRIGFPFEPTTARAYVVAELLCSHLCTPGAGRIHDALRSRTGVAYTGDCDLEIYSDTARFSIYSDVKKENMPQMVASVARSLRELRDRGLTDAELAAARTILLRDVNASNDVPELGAKHYADATVQGHPCPDEIRPIATTITSSEITDLARRVFRTKQAHIAVAGPRDDDHQRAAWQAFESALGD